MSTTTTTTTTTTTSITPIITTSTTIPTAPSRAFISGPLEPPPTYFLTHYIPPLSLALSRSHHFVIGPAPGIDTLTLQYLCSRLPTFERITVFLTEYEEQVYGACYKWFTDRGGKLCVRGRTTSERDEAMTDASDYDVLRYYTEEEAKSVYGSAWWPKVTATENNERRRRQRLRAAAAGAQGVVCGEEVAEKERGRKRGLISGMESRWKEILKGHA